MKQMRTYQYQLWALQMKNFIVNYFNFECYGPHLIISNVFADQGVQFNVIDMSGAWKYRNLWQHQFKNCQGIIYVIDASDKMRMGK